jgi:hypothetical protein
MSRETGEGSGKGAMVKREGEGEPGGGAQSMQRPQGKNLLATLRARKDKRGTELRGGSTVGHEQEGVTLACTLSGKETC